MESKFTPGTNVYTMIEGKAIGPIYLAQIDGDKATLQGLETYVVAVSTLSEKPPLSKAKEGA